MNVAKCAKCLREWHATYVNDPCPFCYIDVLEQAVKVYEASVSEAARSAGLAMEPPIIMIVPRLVAACEQAQRLVDVRFGEIRSLSAILVTLRLELRGAKRRAGYAKGRITYLERIKDGYREDKTLAEQRADKLGAENATLRDIPRYHKCTCPKAWFGALRLLKKSCTCGLDGAQALLELEP